MEDIAAGARQRGVVPPRRLRQHPSLKKGGEEHPDLAVVFPSSQEEGSAEGRGWCGCKSTPTTPSASPTPLLKKGGEEHPNLAVVFPSS